MFQTILVPSDFLTRDSVALQRTKELATLHKSHVYLLHVIETLRDTPFDEMQGFYRDLERAVRTRMQPIYDEFVEANIRCEEHIVFGSRVGEILRCASEWQVNLIVLQSHQVNLAEPYEGWGSLSYKVALLSSCPVLLVK